MTTRKPFCLALMAAVIAVGAAQAQKAGPKLYRWVDKQGKVHYVDALPVEAVDDARREFNAKTGAATGNVDRALTEAERAALAAKAVADAAAAAGANESKRLEDIMMASYEAESDMTRAYGERIALLKLTLESTDVSIRSLNDNLVMILSQASDAELDERKVLDDRIVTLRQLRNERLNQQALQVKRQAELQALNAEFARMLARYRELRRDGAAPATGPVAVPAQVPAGTQG